MGGEYVLKLVDRVGHGHWGGSRWQAEIRVFGTDTKLNRRPRQHSVHMEVHPVDRSDGAAFQPIDTF